MIRTFVTKNLFARNKLFIGGNWKSNNTLQESVALVNNTINNLKYILRTAYLVELLLLFNGIIFTKDQCIIKDAPQPVN